MWKHPYVQLPKWNVKPQFSNRFTCWYFLLLFSGDLSLHRGLPFQRSHFSPDGTNQYTECECACPVHWDRHHHQLSLAFWNHIFTIVCIQSATVRVVQHSVEFEEALAALVIMTAPMAPHLASELWAGWWHANYSHIINDAHTMQTLTHTQSKLFTLNMTNLEMACLSLNVHY